MVGRFASVIVILAVVAGCSSDKDPFKEWDAPQKYQSYVPETARTVAQGTGVLNYAAPENGTLYLVDMSETETIKGTTKPKALLSGYARAGSEIFFDPNAKRAYTKGRQGLMLTNVVPGHNYELRFDPIVKKK
jgi:hypothetical protein